MLTKALKQTVLGRPEVMAAYFSLSLPVATALSGGMSLAGTTLTCRNLRQLLVLGGQRRQRLVSAYSHLLERTLRRLHTKDGLPVPLEQNPLYVQFKKGKQARRVRDYFGSLDRRFTVSLKLPAKNDYPQRQGDLMVLKKANPATGEKGALILTYFNAISAFAALYDLGRIAERRLRAQRHLLLCHSGEERLHLHHRAVECGLDPAEGPQRGGPCAVNEHFSLSSCIVFWGLPVGSRPLAPLGDWSKPHHLEAPRRTVR